MFNVYDSKLRFSMVCKLICRMIAQDEHDLEQKGLKHTISKWTRSKFAKIEPKCLFSRKKTGYEITICQFKHMWFTCNFYFTKTEIVFLFSANMSTSFISVALKCKAFHWWAWHSFFIVGEGLILLKMALNYHYDFVGGSCRIKGMFYVLNVCRL